ncbi:hypothetical protein EYF80_004575 [Liparis tanakae]|uniref:Uncharacterized protein n=1 Tax=Liparis tanakae TaxID=230148 RepID=A0A4Z2J4E5_9TELE|nr:hypothetical protein EYF80_004575 [Liparis tanakae]
MNLFALKGQYTYRAGVTTPPAGLCADAQALASRLLGHEGELSHGAASETVKRGCQGNAHLRCPGNQEEEEEERGGQGMEMHAGKEEKEGGRGGPAGLELGLVGVRRLRGRRRRRVPSLASLLEVALVPGRLGFRPVLEQPSDDLQRNHKAHYCESTLQESAQRGSWLAPISPTAINSYSYSEDMSFQCNTVVRSREREWGLRKGAKAGMSNVTDLCVENGKGLRRVKRDEDPNQELLVFSLQGQGEAIYDAGGKDSYRIVSMYLQMRPGGFECWLVFLRVEFWILTRWESTEDIYRDLENRKTKTREEGELWEQVEECEEGNGKRKMDERLGGMWKEERG